MKLMIVVLAVASLCLAEPEADPQFLYSGYYPYAANYYYPSYYLRPAIASGYGYNTPGSFVQSSRLDKREAEPEADPQLLVAASPYAYTWPYAYTTPFVRALGPHDCVTAEGCAVQAIRHPIVKRDAEADASSLLYAPAYYNGYYNAYNAYYNPYVYNYVPHVAPVVATVNKPVTYTHLGAHPIHDTTVFEQHSAIVGHALVKREAEAEADASSLLYAPAYPAYYNGYYNAYNAYAYNAYPYVYRVPQVAPVVATINKPVTYTHLGAHPIPDTHVVEQHSAVVGHAFV